MKNGQLTQPPKIEFRRRNLRWLIGLASRRFGRLCRKPKFVGFGAQRGGIARNFGISIHNLWDEQIRNLWESRIICGTAPQSTPIWPTPRAAITLRICLPEGRSGSSERTSARRCAAVYSRRAVLSTAPDSLAVSQKSGSRNYESNATLVPEIVIRSRNCATANSSDSNDREFQKLRRSDSWRSPDIRASPSRERRGGPRGRRPRSPPKRRDGFSFGPAIPAATASFRTDQ